MRSGTGVATFTEVTPGNVTVTWLPLSGVGAPSPNPETRQLDDRATVTFSGVYTPQLPVLWMTH